MLLMWRLSVILVSVATFYNVGINAACGDKCHYLLLAPKNIHVGSNADLSLSLFGVDTKGSLKVKLLQENKTLAEKTFTDIDPTQSPISLEFPVDAPSGGYYGYKLVAEGNFGEYSFTNETSINIREKRRLVFVQTDKPIYKPGQTVKLRVLPVSSELKPIKDAVATIVITDPDTNRLAQWNNVTFEKGIIQREFKLSDEPVLGSNWAILVDFGDKEPETRQYFEVAEYVLPKFEVTVTPPPYALTSDQTITYKICAKYTYGKGVEGDVTINATYPRDRYYYRYPEQYGPIPQQTENGTLDADGCYKFVLNAAELNFTRSYNYGVIYGQRIAVTASVTEKGTGLERNATGYISPTNSPLTLSFPSSDGPGRYFKPRMPYYGKIRVAHPDDTPAPNEVIQVCAVSVRERYCGTFYHEKKTMVNCKNYTSDDKGIVDFVIPPYNASVVSVNLVATAMNYPTTFYNDLSQTVMIRQPTSSSNLQAFWSPSENFLQFDPTQESKYDCDTNITARALYTVPADKSSMTFYYQIVSRGEIVADGKHEVNSHDLVDLSAQSSSWIRQEHKCVDMERPEANEQNSIAQLNLPITVKPSYMPSIRVLLWYVLNNEVVASAQEFDLKPCLENDVKLSFEPGQVQPGGNVSLKLSASPDSYCGYGVVDKSVYLLKKDNGITRDTIVSVLKRLDIGRWTAPTPDTYNYCRKKQTKSSAGSIIGNPYGSQSSDYVDTEFAISDAGFTSMSDFELATRPCYSLQTRTSGVSNYPRPGLPAAAPVPPLAIHAVDLKASAFVSSTRENDFASPSAAPAGGFAGGSGAAQATESLVDVRQDFSDTWLFDLVAVDESGNAVVSSTTPHSITEWVGNAVCVNDKTGMGVSEPATFQTFQAFFVNMDMPYSVKRGESFDLKVSVFNYLNDSLPIKYKVTLPDELKASENALTSSVLCLMANKNEVITIPVKAQDINDVKIKISGESATDDPNLSECSANNNLVNIKARDAIEKTLIIKPEGFKTSRVENWLVCTDDKDSNTSKVFDLSSPADAIAGSQRVMLGVTGDLMGPPLRNLDRVIQLPTGCGEQNIAKFAPNVFAYRYMQAINKVEADKEKEIIQNLRAGYQNQQKFRHHDGSFSVWGPRTTSQPSMMLTAFTFKMFMKAKPIIPDTITNTVETQLRSTTGSWIKNRQENVTGCFPLLGSTFSPAIKGRDGVSKGPMTSYTLISLLESGETPKDTELALRCIGAQPAPYPHNLAMAAYAAALAGNESLAKSYLAELEKVAISKINIRYWNSMHPQSSSTGDVETAAYAVLAYLSLNDVERAQAIVRYLATQRNPYGGFYSSQDTAIALQAISEFGAKLGSKPVNMDVTVTRTPPAAENQDTFALREEDRLVMQQKLYRRPAPTEMVAGISSTAQGCGLVISEFRYNVPFEPRADGFQFNVSVQPTPEDAGAAQPRRVRLNMNVRYIGNSSQSNMAIIELEIPSGYSYVAEQLQELVNQRVAQTIDYTRYENVIFYFDKFTDQQSSIPVVLERNYAVKGLSDSIAKIYDYYDVEHKMETKFNVNGVLPDPPSNN